VNWCDKKFINKKFSQKNQFIAFCFDFDFIFVCGNFIKIIIVNYTEPAMNVQYSYQLTDKILPF
jgi:hypothetical protein